MYFVRALKNIMFASVLLLLLFSLLCQLLAHIFTYFSPLNAISQNKVHGKENQCE